MYSNSECVDMVHLYGFCDRNVNAARHEYAISKQKIDKFFLTFQRLKETGSFNIVPRTDRVFAK